MAGGVTGKRAGTPLQGVTGECDSRNLHCFFVAQLTQLARVPNF
jgi:hypothetical protein